jgi:ABC-type transporter Mla subunit MlaD
MDPLGIKKIIGILEREGGIIPQSEADLKKIGAALDAGGVFIGEATELVEKLNAFAETLPEDKRELMHAVAWLTDHFVRVGTQASNAAQEARGTAAEARSCIAEVRSFLDDLRTGRVKFVTETKVEKA